jgi:hypothetical protein
MAVLNQAILNFESVTDMSLGQFLVTHGYIEESALTQALLLQKQQKRSIEELLSVYGSAAVV